MDNTFGLMFRATTFGESHGPAVGVIVDGCPPRLPLAVADVQRELDRRRPGTGRLSSPRQEPDRVEILSGILDGLTLGTPIAMVVRNQDQRPGDYQEVRTLLRPSHADYTYQAKFGIRAWEGGGRASARETIGRVAAGAVAKRLLATLGIEVLAWVRQVHEVEAQVDAASVTAAAVEANALRCPDPAAAATMAALVDRVWAEGDSVGGVVAAVARRVPPGLGGPVFAKLEADLAAALLSIPAARGFEIGSGFSGTRLRGSEHNDAFITDASGRIRTATNRSGGVQGGISNGEDIQVAVAFKPTPTILREQQTVDVEGRPTPIRGLGRHDPCVLPRAVPVVEAMIALVLADHALRQRGQCGAWVLPNP